MATRIIHAPQLWMWSRPSSSARPGVAAHHLWMCGMKKATIGRHQGDTLINSFDCPRILIPQGFHLFQATCGKGAVGGDRATPGRQISRENAGKWLRIGVLGCLGDAALVIAMVMMVAGVVAVQAATITVTDNTGLNHSSYKAYQIFTGTQAADQGALGDIAWGNGVNTTNFVSALNTEFNLLGNDTLSVSDPAGVAAYIGRFQSNTANANKVAKIALDNKATGTDLTVGNNTMDTGYYLVVDETAIAADADDVNNAALLQLTTAMTIEKKTDKPTLDKKIKHNDTDNWEVVGDNQIGDDVEFLITTSVPDVTYYDTYKYTIHDTLSNGLDLQQNTIKIYTDATLQTELNSRYYEVKNISTNDTSGVTTFDIEITIKTTSALNVDKTSVPNLYTYYKATLADDALIYDAGKQDNKAYLEYE